MKNRDFIIVHPEDSSNMIYWSSRWGVSPRDVSSAIIETGSLSARQIKAYLKIDPFHKPALKLRNFYSAFLRIIS